MQYTNSIFKAKLTFKFFEVLILNYLLLKLFTQTFQFVYYQLIKQLSI